MSVKYYRSFKCYVLNITRLFYTIKYLTIKQVVGRINFYLPKLIFKADKYPVIKSDFSVEKFIERINITSDYKHFNFLNQSFDLDTIGWNNMNVSKLWNYNLHYFDYLIRDEYYSELIKEQSELIDDWIKENSFGQGVGWEAYPTSVRIVNWIKWHLRTSALKENQLLSLWNQIRWLERNLEFHLLGNHLFMNVKALLFANVLFKIEKKSSINKCEILFKREFGKQFLADGAHFELSPMYHSLGIEDLLDIINISDSLPFKLDKGEIYEKICRALFWLNSMKYDNQELANFNDSANNVAPKFSTLVDYCKRLRLQPFVQKPNYVHYFPESGFFILKDEQIHFIADVGKIGPDYLPGHAHADSLSFELAIEGHRIIVNSGTSLYENNSLRLFQRGTSAHSTLVIDETNSSDTWSSFRVAKRAYPFNFFVNDDYFNSGNLSFGCSHDGYKRLSGSPIHNREWIFSNNSLTVKDSIDGRFEKAIVYFYFHPNLEVNLENRLIKLAINKRIICTIEIDNTHLYEIEKSNYYNEFGSSAKVNKCLKIYLQDNSKNTIVFHY
jgi:uncharacterized heparinase superfamily protein